VSYNNGVSPGGMRYYDAILSYAGDKYAAHVMASLSDFEIKNRLHNSVCRENAKDALSAVKSNVINLRIIEYLDYLISNIQTNEQCISDSKFRKLTQDYINWN
jgi:hypothetical protein